MSTIHSDDSADTLKMLRETFCIAQSAIQHRPYDEDRKPGHVARLGRLIDDIDRQRPLGSDGKHGNRHTPTCGCDDGETARGPWWRQLWLALIRAKRSDYTWDFDLMAGKFVRVPKDRLSDPGTGEA